MKNLRLPIVLAAALLAAGCGRLQPQPVVKKPMSSTPPPSSAQAWTPERIAADPVGYLSFADKEVVRQTAERDKRLKQTEAARATVSERADKLKQDIRDAANIRKRMQAAIARGDEDAAWPITFAGAKFDRAKAVALQAASQRFVESRTPLSADYEHALAKIDAAAQALKSDISELGQLREKLALDMERVRLNQGIAEVAELRKSVDALSGFATSLADTTDNPLEDLAAKARPLVAEAELESLLGK